MTISGVEDGGTYDLRLRWRVPGALLPGTWTEHLGHTVVGQSSAPPALTGLALHAWGENSILIRWDPIATADARVGGQVRFRHSEAAANPTWGHAVSIGEPIDRQSYAILPAKPGWYLARVFDASGRGSGVVIIGATSSQLLDYASLSTITESPTFPGAKTDVQVSGSALVLDSGETEGTYEFDNEIDLGSTKPVRVTSVIEIEGTDRTDAHVEFRTTTDDPASASAAWTAWKWLDAEQVRARGFEFRLQMRRAGADPLRVTVLGAVVDEPITSGINWRGNWSSGTSYESLDSVSYDNASWVCIQAHAASSSNAPGTAGGDAYWDILVDSLRWKGTWTEGENYITRDIVASGGRSWVCTGDHTASAANQPISENGGGVYWDLLADVGVAGNDGHGLEWHGEWAIGVEYRNTDLLQDLVSHDGQSFICLQTHTSTDADAPGTTGGAAFWDLLAGLEIDRRTPDAPDVTLAATGLGTDAFYFLLAGIELSSELGGPSVDRTRIQVSVDETGHSTTSGWSNPLQQIEVARPPIAQRLLVNDYGTYWVSAQVRNGVTRVWSPWSAPLSALTVRSAADAGLPSAPALQVLRPDPNSDAVEVTIGRPKTNYLTIWGYDIQARTGDSATAALPSNQDYTTGVHPVQDSSVQASGSGTVVPGGRVLTVTGASPDWGVDDLAGKILYVYRSINTTVGSVGFPLGNLIVSNTADSVTIQSGSTFRLPPGETSLTFKFLIAESWLSAPDDLVTRQTAILRGEHGSVDQIPLEHNLQLLLSQSTFVRVRANNLYGLGPWSSVVEVAGKAADELSSALTATLVADSTSVQSGSPVVLTWSSTNAKSASIDQGVGSVTPVAGSTTVNPTATTTYTITVTGADGSTETASVKITVSSGAPSVGSFTADPTEITTAGSSSTLSWTTSNATSVSINQGVGSVTPVASGSVVVYPTDTTTYKITATNSEGSATKTVEVTVNVPASTTLPTIETFSATPSTINFGDSIMLKWTTTGGDSVEIEVRQFLGPHGWALYKTFTGLSANGTKTYTPGEINRRRFILKATNGAGTVTNTINITINRV